MNVKVRWNGKMSFVGVTGSNHAVVMDTSAQNGGEGSAASPMEMVLLGLAGCSGIDVVSIINKKRITLDSFEMQISAERAEDHPKVFTKVNADYVFRGENLSRKALEDAVRLSVEKYCSVAGMISKTATINWQVLIEGENQA